MKDFKTLASFSLWIPIVLAGELSNPEKALAQYRIVNSWTATTPAAIAAAAVKGGPSKPAPHPDPDFYLKNSPQNLRTLYLSKLLPRIPKGIFKFQGRAPIYFSNGQGSYCWYKTWEDFIRLNGGVNPGWRIQSGRLSNYSALYRGICTGGPSKPAPHPDPDFRKPFRGE